MLISCVTMGQWNNVSPRGKLNYHVAYAGQMFWPLSYRELVAGGNRAFSLSIAGPKIVRVLPRQDIGVAAAGIPAQEIVSWKNLWIQCRPARKSFGYPLHELLWALQFFQTEISATYKNYTQNKSRYVSETAMRPKSTNVTWMTR